MDNNSSLGACGQPCSAVVPVVGWTCLGGSRCSPLRRLWVWFCWLPLWQWHVGAMRHLQCRTALVYRIGLQSESMLPLSAARHGFFLVLVEGTLMCGISTSCTW